MGSNKVEVDSSCTASHLSSINSGQILVFMQVLLTMGNFHTAILVCLLVGLYEKV